MMRLLTLLTILAPLALTGCIALPIPDGAAASHALTVLAILATAPIACMVMALPFVVSPRR